ncbi:hypothetical protein NGH32_07235 [Staphylococcus xylosus]|uniref:hypothetical protein n=1 Tax=Staphylococcus xylosus TaxID=1288 RepID=UPI002DBD2ACC|nr:hypothetical protein [Staphylococcus xylosus]MEB8150494.1 hypothetical protein [Staphylococcus xylosus]
MKIKTKKQLNLPQLIEWAWDNGVRNVTFRGLDKKGYVVSISINDKGEFTSDWRISKNDLFTVEVEEEITEETPLPMVIECDEDLSFWVFEDITLKNLHEYRCVKETTKYYRDTDENMHLIWRDGKLVE